MARTLKEIEEYRKAKALKNKVKTVSY